MLLKQENMLNQTSFYSAEELAQIGFKSYGKNVLISRYCRIYKPQNIEFGDKVRIDDFCVLSAGTSIKFGSYIHIGCGTSIIGSGEVVISDFSGVSGHCSIYSSSDDYSGRFMTNPMVPEELTNVTHAPVILGKHVIIGCGSVILPGVTLEDGVAIGAMSLVQQDCKANTIYCGNPLKKLIPRSKKHQELEQLINK